VLSPVTPWARHFKSCSRIFLQGQCVNHIVQNSRMRTRSTSVSFNLCRLALSNLDVSVGTDLVMHPPPFLHVTTLHYKINHKLIHKADVGPTQWSPYHEVYNVTFSMHVPWWSSGNKEPQKSSFLTSCGFHSSVNTLPGRLIWNSSTETATRARLKDLSAKLFVEFCLLGLMASLSQVLHFEGQGWEGPFSARVVVGDERWPMSIKEVPVPGLLTCCVLRSLVQLLSQVGSN
jgi:hypothetical protein